MKQIVIIRVFELLQALVVKTHERDAESLAQFDKVILLVRDPAQAILAEFNRLNSKSHVDFAGLERFLEDDGKGKHP